MTSPEPTEEQQQLSPGDFWTTVTGVAPGDQIAILIPGSAGAITLRLKDFVLGPFGPVALLLESADGITWTMPFSGFYMFTKEPDVKAPDMTPEGLVAWSDEQGIEVPAEVREYVERVNLGVHDEIPADLLAEFTTDSLEG